MARDEWTVVGAPLRRFSMTEPGNSQNLSSLPPECTGPLGAIGDCATPIGSVDLSIASDFARTASVKQMTRKIRATMPKRQEENPTIPLF